MMALFFYFSKKSNFKVGGSARFLGETGGELGLNEEDGNFSRA